MPPIAAAAGSLRCRDAAAIPAVFAVLGVSLANVAIYLSSFMYSLRFGHTGGDSLSVLAHTLGIILGVVLLPHALAGKRLVRIAALCCILGVWLARFPGLDGWSYGLARTWIGVFGFGLLVPAAHALFFSVLPQGQRGLWYGAGVGLGFLIWRIMHAIAAGSAGTPEAALWFNRVYFGQGLLLLCLALILLWGLTRKGLVPGSPANRAADSPASFCGAGPAEGAGATEESASVKGAVSLCGAAALFFLAAGLLNALILPAGPNPYSRDVPWALTFLAVGICPLVGRYADRNGLLGVRRVFLACSGFLVLAPTLETLNRSHVAYDLILACASLAQFSVLTAGALGLAALGAGARRYGAVGLAVWLLRSLAVFSYLLFTKFEIFASGEDSGLNVVLATVAAMLFYVAAWRLDNGRIAGSSDNARPAAPAGSEGNGAAPALEAPALDFAARYRLSEREMQVLNLLAAGCTGKDAALRLGLKEGTVRAMVHRMREKTGTYSRDALVELRGRDTSAK